MPASFSTPCSVVCVLTTERTVPSTRTLTRCGRLMLMFMPVNGTRAPRSTDSTAACGILRPACCKTSSTLSPVTHALCVTPSIVNVNNRPRAMLMVAPSCTFVCGAGVNASCGPTVMPARCKTPSTDAAYVRTFVTWPSTEMVTCLSRLTNAVVPATRAAVMTPHTEPTTSLDRTGLRCSKGPEDGKPGSRGRNLDGTEPRKAARDADHELPHSGRT